MVRWLRRTIALAVITAIALTLVRRTRPSAGAPTVAPPSAWPPFEPRAAVVAVTATAVAVAPVEPAEATDWVEPIDGGCPDGYPVKANDNSRIFHVPGGRFYDRTRAERCYATAEAAERDGYRRAKA